MRELPDAFQQTIREVAFWCSTLTLTATHEDSPEESRRRGLIKAAGGLLDRYHRERVLASGVGSILRLQPSPEELWDRAMKLLKEADPDSLVPLEHQLRNPDWKPVEALGSSSTFDTPAEIVKAVVDQRSARLRQMRAGLPVLTGVQQRGRLLWYVPCENVSDGASRYASQGFFDLYDCPPWDLWISYADRTLVSWVPEVLAPLAQAGIDGNAVECIGWMD